MFERLSLQRGKFYRAAYRADAKIFSGSRIFLLTILLDNESIGLQVRVRQERRTSPTSTKVAGNEAVNEANRERETTMTYFSMVLENAAYQTETDEQSIEDRINDAWCDYLYTIGFKVSPWAWAN
jgi:hypothetical protein